MRNIRLLLLLFGVFALYGANGQQTITGVITDTSSMPLSGASVQVKNTTRGAVADFDGNYSIEAERGEILVFSYIGFNSQEFTVGDSTTLNVSLSEGNELDEVVVVGYGTQKKVTVTGAVSAIKGDVITKSPAVDISNSLAGRLSGLVVVQTSGEPGNDGAEISIRGSNTLGNSSPLIVIDGVPDRSGGLGRLSPGDIESISVLKDASAAIYGARAANGAIIITTKRGGKGKPSITYDYNLGWSQPTRTPDLANAVEYAKIRNELPIYNNIPVSEWGAASTALQTTGTYDSPTPDVPTIDAVFSPEDVELYRNGSDPFGHPDTDWFGAVFKDWSVQERHNLQISGGNEDVRYFASLGFLDQDAFYKNSATYYKQYSLRTNVDAKVNDYISTNINVMLRREDRNYPTEDAGAIFRMLMRGKPTDQAVWPSGEPGPDIENGQNPVVITTNATGYIKNPKDLIQVNGGLEITNPWIDGLKLNLMASVDVVHESFKEWRTPWELFYWDGITFNGDSPQLEPAVRSNFTDPRLRQEARKEMNTNLTAMLSYDRTFNEDHNVSVMAGVTKENFSGDNFSAFRRNYISAAVDQLFAGGNEGQIIDGSAYERARLGYYGRAQYNFKEKYLMEFIWRYDGSYIFPESSRFGFFPGVLVGWNITDEDWFNVKNVDRLKIRASYGQMGNDQVAFDLNGDGVLDLQEYAFLSTYGFGAYPINGSVQTTLIEALLANPDFTWERANNFNVGLDGRIFDKVNFSLEYFLNRRSQILIQKTGSTPGSSGINNILPPVNAGKVDNKGFESAFDYTGRATDITYKIGLNGGYAKNEVVFLDEVPGIPEWQKQEGKPINAYLVYQSDGAFLDQAEIDANTLDYSGVTSQLLPGDMKFKDVNNDGKIDGDDQVRLDENITPKFTFGATFDLTYKNFDFAMLFQGALGASVPVQTESGDIGNYLKYSFDNRWSIDNPSSTDPRLASRGDTYYTGGNYGNNTYFLFSKDYIRLKNVEIGYNFKDDILGKSGISNLRVYVNALNLFTIDKFGIFDPETTSQTGVFYPQARVINTGVSLTF